MESVSGIKIKQLQVDGGTCQNDFLMQFQADILNTEIHRPKQIESTAIGVALLAGIGAGVWKSDQLPSALLEKDVIFNPTMDTSIRNNNIIGWKKAIRQAQTN